MQVRTTFTFISMCFLFSLTGTANSHEEHHKETAASASDLAITADYQYVPITLKLPDSVDLQHAHGLTRDDQDNIYLAYSSNTINDNTHAIIQFDSKGNFVRFIGDASLAKGVPHGLDLVYEDNVPYLYLSNNASTVRKIDMQGKVLWEKASKPEHANYKDKQYRPTDTAKIPSSSNVFIADGYGNSKVIEVTSKEGDFTQVSLDGTGSEKVFNTPHGVTFDPRSGQIVVSDRENYRLVVYDAQGNLDKTVAVPGVSRVCNTDVWQDKMLITNLDGTVAVLNRQNEQISNIPLATILGNKGHKHPHDAIFMSNGDIVIGTWNPGRLSYWKKLTTTTFHSQ